VKGFLPHGLTWNIKMRENNIPLFYPCTHSSVESFDFIGFTLQYEMSYTNITLICWILSGIPCTEKLKRTKEHPFVCAGRTLSYNAPDRTLSRRSIRLSDLAVKAKNYN